MAKYFCILYYEEKEIYVYGTNTYLTNFYKIIIT